MTAAGNRSIRPARIDDAAEFAGLIQRSKADAMPWLDVVHTAEENIWWLENILLVEDDVLVVVESSVIVGTIAVCAGWVDQLYLLPGFQGRGMGRLLLDHAKAASDGALQLWTFQRNRRARTFYERNGFQAVEETDGATNEEREPDVRYL